MVQMKRGGHILFFSGLLHYVRYNVQLYIVISKVNPPNLPYTPFLSTLDETNLYSIDVLPGNKQHVPAPGERALILVPPRLHPVEDHWTCTDTPGDSVQLPNTLGFCRVVCGVVVSACVLDQEILYGRVAACASGQEGCCSGAEAEAEAEAGKRKVGDWYFYVLVHGI